MHKETSRIIAVDPGFDRIGIAVLEGTASSPVVLFSECFETNRNDTHAQRLRALGERVAEVIGEWQPSAMAIEELFFSQNRTTGIKVAEARGVIIFAAAQAGIPVREHAPTSVKLAVAGYGRADKAQVKTFVLKIARLESKKGHDDEYDAIAVGIADLAVGRNYPHRS